MHGDTAGPADRQPNWAPRLHLSAVPDHDVAAIVAAVDPVLREAGFERLPFGVRAINDDTDRLDLCASWIRRQLRDDVDTEVYSDGVSVWGSGLIRIGIDDQSVELITRNTDPDTLAAMIGVLLDIADAPYL